MFAQWIALQGLVLFSVSAFAVETAPSPVPSVTAPLSVAKYRIYDAALELHQANDANSKILAYLPYGINVDAVTFDPALVLQWAKVRFTDGTNQLEGYVLRHRIGLDSDPLSKSEEAEMVRTGKLQSSRSFFCFAEGELKATLKEHEYLANVDAPEIDEPAQIASDGATQPVAKNSKLAKKGCQPANNHMDLNLIYKPTLFRGYSQHWERIAYWKPTHLESRTHLWSVMLDPESSYAITPRWLLLRSAAFYTVNELTAPTAAAEPSEVKKLDSAETPKDLPEVRPSFFKSNNVSNEAVSTLDALAAKLKDFSQLRASLLAAKEYKEKQSFIVAKGISKIFINLADGQTKVVEGNLVIQPQALRSQDNEGYDFITSESEPKFKESTQFDKQSSWIQFPVFYSQQKIKWPQASANQVKFMAPAKKKPVAKAQTDDESDNGEESSSDGAMELKQLTIDFNNDGVADWASIHGMEEGHDGDTAVCDDWINIDGKWQIMGHRER